VVMMEANPPSNLYTVIWEGSDGGTDLEHISIR
jgi:hypothetical protein